VFIIYYITTKLKKQFININYFATKLKDNYLYESCTHQSYLNIIHNKLLRINYNMYKDIGLKKHILRLNVKKLRTCLKKINNLTFSH